MTSDPNLPERSAPQRFNTSNSVEGTEAKRKQRWLGLMSLSTLAEYLDMSVTTVANLVKTGQLPPPTVAPSPRLKRWSRQSIDTHFHDAANARLSGPSIDDLMARSFPATRGGN